MNALYDEVEIASTKCLKCPAVQWVKKSGLDVKSEFFCFPLVNQDQDIFFL